MLTGKVAPFRDADEPSAIAKQPVAGPIAVGHLGLAGDEQADRIHHGGPDKALNYYPHDHYAYWRRAIGDHPLLAAPGAFGENLSGEGLIEEDLCIGDRFRLGTTLVEVSHGRMPCWKISHRFAVPKLTSEVVRTGRAGWYFRVIEPGAVSAGDTLELTARGHAEWSVDRAFALIVRGEGARDLAALSELAEMAELATTWRSRAAGLLAQYR